MAFAYFLLFTFVSSLSFTSHGLAYQNQTLVDPMIIAFCSELNNQDCIASLNSHIGIEGHGSPTSIMIAALHHTLDQTKSAMEALTKFTTLSVRYREQIAIEDCTELLDFSVSELASSMDEMNKISSGFGDQHSSGNLKAWLSAALSNQDTCLEGFEGTDRLLEKFIRGNLFQVNQLIANVLSFYTKMHRHPFTPQSNYTDGGRNFPAWITKGDEELLLSNPNGMHVDAVVSTDEEGHYRSITQAILEAPNHSARRYVIYVKKGIYTENVDIKKRKTNIMLIGDGIGKTIITGDRNFLQGWTTFHTATFAVSGKGFIARDITFRNTAGPGNRQAVALRVDSDHSAFYRCSMEGYQDTLYAHSLRQFYRECSISGTIDFIFGNGAAVFQNCKIYTRRPLPQQKVTITAQGRKNPHQSTGFSFQDSVIYATRPTYLGRPWKLYSRTVFMNTYMSSMVQPRGWLEWIGDFALDTLYYGEYRNYGPGAALAGRVNWPGYHIINDAATAEFFTVGKFIDGTAWLPATGIKFSLGLSG